MDAAPYLARIAELLARHGLEAVLIGNAAAALQGAPVTPLGFEFLCRRTPANLRKLKAIAKDLKAGLFRPIEPPGDWIRLSRDIDALQIDFRPAVSIEDFERRRKRAKPIQFRAAVETKRERHRTSAMREVVSPRRTAMLEALKKQSELLARDSIRALLALPPERRTNFLRKRVGICMSCL